MLHIVLTILKIIGIIILAILGVLILLVCIVLITPLRYQLKASAQGNVDSIQAKLKFSWLMHVVSGYVEYQEKEVAYQIKIFGRKIDLEKNNSKQTEVQKTETQETETQEAEIKETGTQETEIKETEFVAADKKADEPKGIQKQPKDLQSVVNKKKSKEKKYTIQNLCDKIKKITNIKDKVVEFIRHETHVSAFKRVLIEVKRLFCFLKPKKFHLNLHFGFEDPSLTGKVLGAVSILYPFFEKHMNLEPDFQNAVLEGDIYVKGHVRGIYAIILGVNLLLDKNIRMTVKDIKKLIDNK